MTTEELKEIQKHKCETSTVEIKSAEYDWPKRLYDTLSNFSNRMKEELFSLESTMLKGSYVRGGDSGSQ